MMESAKDFIEYYFNGQLHLQGELEKMLSDRDAAIRKECADRAVGWYIQGVPEPSRDEYAKEIAELSAAIMGDKHDRRTDNEFHQGQP